MPYKSGGEWRKAARGPVKCAEHGVCYSECGCLAPASAETDHRPTSRSFLPPPSAGFQKEIDRMKAAMDAGAEVPEAEIKRLAKRRALDLLTARRPSVVAGAVRTLLGKDAPKRSINGEKLADEEDDPLDLP